MAEKIAQLNKPMEVKASARNLRISPRKMRLVTNLLKDMTVSDALVQLRFTNKKGAAMVTKLLQSAVANAENNFSLKAGSLVIKSITTNMGAMLKRAFPRARGSAFVIRHKLAHVNLILESRNEPNKKVTVPAKKTVKQDAVVVTQEGTLGLPVEKSQKIVKPAQATAKHHENEATSVKQKAKPEHSTK
jgi:large subunit ribosomal protein L22